MKHFSFWTVDSGLLNSDRNRNKSDNALELNSYTGIVLALALLTASGAMAQDRNAFPPGAEQREAQLMQRVGPQTRAWIAQEARREAAQPELSEQMAIASVRANAAEFGNLGDGDVMAIAFIVLMEASKGAHEDLKAIIDVVKSNNEAKERARQRQTKVRTDAAISQHAIQASGSSPAIARKPVPAASRVDTAARPLPKVQLDSHVDKAKSDPDSLSEVSDTESLRLQMAMDRLSQSMSTVSNMLKKLSDTNASITRNIK